MHLVFFSYLLFSHFERGVCACTSHLTLPSRPRFHFEIFVFSLDWLRVGLYISGVAIFFTRVFDLYPRTHSPVYQPVDTMEVSALPAGGVSCV